MVVTLTLDGHVAIVELRRPPNNFIDEALADALASKLERLDGDPACRAVLLVSEGKHFCAGANLAARLDEPEVQGRHLYDHLGRLVAFRKPIVAAVQGAAVGAGLGLAVLADFRVACPEARFSANFNLQGYHPGFALTYTLPRLIGIQHAAWMIYSGKRVAGDAAMQLGLIDRLVPLDSLRSEALDMAQEIAGSGPLAVVETRASLRGEFATHFAATLRRERAVQDALRETEDYREGVRAMNERRKPEFKGR